MKMFAETEKTFMIHGKNVKLGKESHENES